MSEAGWKVEQVFKWGRVEAGWKVGWLSHLVLVRRNEDDLEIFLGGVVRFEGLVEFSQLGSESSARGAPVGRE